MFSKNQKNKIQFKNKYYKVKKLFNYNKFENWLLYYMKITSEKVVKENNINLKLDSPRTIQAC